MKTNADPVKLRVWFSTALTRETASSWQIQDRKKERRTKRIRKRKSTNKGGEMRGSGRRRRKRRRRRSRSSRALLVAMVGCHVLTCPSVVILCELRLFVDDHASDGHVRVLLFGLLYSLGQRLTVTHPHKQNKHKPNKRFNGKITRMKTQLNTHRRGKHTCTRTPAALDLQQPSLRLWGRHMSRRYGNPACACLSTSQPSLIRSRTRARQTVRTCVRLID